jgi:excinuclease ABC subunit A
MCLGRIFRDYQRHILLYGSDKDINHVLTSSSGNQTHKWGRIEGVKTMIERRYSETTSKWMMPYYESFMRDDICQTCHGARLNEAALSVQVNGLNIYEATQLTIDKLLAWLDDTRSKLTPNELQIADLILKEIHNRASFLGRCRPRLSDA